MAAASALIGSVGPYNETEDFETYLERVNLFFDANAVANEKKVAALLTLIGPKPYAVLRSLVAPDNPKDKTFAQNVNSLKAHYCPKPLAIVERFRFMKRLQAEGESIKSYKAELQRLSTHCAFGGSLHERLRDQFVVGLKNESIQRKLLTERDLSFARAVEIALATETASKDAKELSKASSASSSGTGNSVQFVKKQSQRKHGGSAASANSKTDTKYQGRSTYCFRSGDKSHKADRCAHKNTECNFCGKRGHLRKVCLTEKKGKPPPAQPKPTGKGVHLVNSAETHADEGYELFDLYHMKTTGSASAFVTKMTVNDRQLSMEIDTGAAVTLMSEKTFVKEFGNIACLKPSRCRLRTYTGEPLPAIGRLDVKVSYQGTCYDLPLLVVRGAGPTLLGRDWLSVIRLDWKQVYRADSEQEDGVHRITLDSVLSKYPDIGDGQLGKVKGVKGKFYIDPDVKPKFFKPRSVAYAITDKVETEIDRLRSESILTPVKFADWAAPIVPVMKADKKTVRICGDFKLTVNKAARVEKYPMPKVEDLYAKLAGGKKFTKLDLKNAYLQIELEEESKKYTTINTSKGLFQYNRLPFGVSSAPAIFQRIIDSILSGLPYVVARMDDVLISGASDEEHLEILDEVLRRLHEAGIKLNMEKCKFLADSVIYLGYKIDAEGIHPVEEKVRAIAQAPTPMDVKELRSYLGCLNYYAKFLPNLSMVLAPLHELLVKNVLFHWGSEQESAFRQSKDLLQSSQVLVHYDPTKDIVLSCDASPKGIGAVVSHRFENGDERPICFASRTLTSAERNYSQLEKEALSIVWGVKKFHSYLYGHEFVIYNDHKPLEYLLSENKPVPPLASARIQRWALTLGAYQYVLKYKPGSQMCAADAMSRLPLSDSAIEVPLPAETICLLEFMDTSPIDVELIKYLTGRDPVLSRVRRFVSAGWPGKVEEELRPYFTRKLELSVEGGCILWGARVIVPKAARNRVLGVIHEAHPGIVRMKTFARHYVWWPCLDKDLEDKVKHCEACQVRRHAPAKALLHPWEYPSRPWSRLHIDYAGPYKGKMLLIIVDAYTKWIEVHVMNSSTAELTVEKLRTTFAMFGIPDTIVSDNGTNFVSEVFQTFMSRNGVKHIKVAPKHPASNGLAERAVQSVKEGIDKLVSGSIETKMARFLFKYRSTPHATTGRTPAEMMFNRQIKTHLDLLHPDVRATVGEKQGKQKLYHDTHAKERNFEVGDKVYVTNFSSGPCWLKGVITERTGPLSFVVELVDGRMVRRHVDHIRKRYVQEQVDIGPELPTVGLPATGAECDTNIVPQPSVPVVSEVPNVTSSSLNTPVQDSAPPVAEDKKSGGNVESAKGVIPRSPVVTQPPEPIRRSQRVRKAPERLDL
ncbi:uncharacterized protein K02A2.6-like [Lineus longissimus]|uniref:uncharacterized protein K02A2.6-like n=1 Tax=Lineus longissimus TaxID=88925 RepID=UPI00315D38DD